MTLVREMPVLAAARIIGITDQRLWRIVEHYVGKAVERLDLTRVKAIGLDETAAKRGQTYVTVFIDLDRKDKPMVFVTPGRDKETVAQFKTFLAEHGGSPNHIVEVVCDMSGAFLAAVGETFDEAVVTVDRFHVVQMFTKAVDEVRRAEAKHKPAQGPALGHPQARRRPPHQGPGRGSRGTRSLGSADRHRLADQGDAPLDPQSRQHPGRPLAHHPLPAPRQGTPRRRRILDPIRKALDSFENHLERILQRWTSSHSNARLEGLNGLFQAARARARGYRTPQPSRP